MIRINKNVKNWIKLLLKRINVIQMNKNGKMQLKWIKIEKCNKKVIKIEKCNKNE